MTLLHTIGQRLKQSAGCLMLYASNLLHAYGSGHLAQIT